MLNYEEYSYCDMIYKLNQKAEELYSIGEITLQQKKYVNQMKKELDSIAENIEAFKALTEYSENLVKDENSEYYNPKYDDILDEIANECFIIPKSGSTAPDVSSMVKGDTITDGQLIIEKVDYNIFDSKEYTTIKDNINYPYANRKSDHEYCLDDIYNIGNASFKVVDYNGN